VPSDLVAQSAQAEPILAQESLESARAHYANNPRPAHGGASVGILTGSRITRLQRLRRVARRTKR
jgi:hypothetical protein